MRAPSARNLIRCSVAAVLTATLVGSAAVAPAFAVPPNGDDETLHAASVMLVPGDLRAPIQTGHRHSFASDTGIATAPYVCTLRARTITLPDVLQPSTSAVFGYRHRGATQSVYDYGSIGAAGAAWNKLVHRLARCARVSGPISVGKMSTSVFGQTGRWIYAPSSSQARSYTTWITLGTTIQSFEFAVPWRQHVSGAQRQAWQQLTNQLGTRWIEVDTPVIPVPGPVPPVASTA